MATTWREGWSRVAERRSLVDGFELLPTDDAGFGPEAALDAAAATALERTRIEPDFVMPFGRTPLFDFEAGRFVRIGGSPAWTTGHNALKQWCWMAAYTARFAHPIFSDDFGVAAPQGGLGLTGEDAEEAADDYRVELREALLVHDRIDEVELRVEFDPVQGVIFISDFIVTTDEDVEVGIEDFQLGVSGGITDG